MSTSNASGDASEFELTKRENRLNTLNTTMEASTHMLLAMMTAAGFTRLTSTNALKEAKALVDRISDDNINVTASMSDNAIETIKRLADSGNPQGIELLNNLYERYGQFAIDNPAAYEIAATSGALVSGVAAFMVSRIGLSNTFKDFSKYYDGGYEGHLRDKIGHDGEVYSQKYRKEALSRSFQNNLTRFAEKLSDGCNSFLAISRLTKQRQSSSLFFKLDSESPKLAGLIKALHDLSMEKQPRFSHIREDKAFQNKVLNALLADKKNLSRYFEINKVGIHEFNQAVQGALGKDAAIIIKGAHKHQDARKGWHELRSDVLTKTFQKISLYNIQKRASDSIAELLIAQQSGRMTRGHIKQLQQVMREQDNLLKLASRDEHKHLKKTFEDQSKVIQGILSPIFDNKASHRSRTEGITRYLEKIGVERGAIMTDENKAFIRQEVSASLNRDSEVKRKSFKGHYFETMLETLQSKMTEYFQNNDFKLSDLSSKSEEDITSLCREHGLRFTGDLALLADKAGRSHLRGITAKVFGHFSNKPSSENYLSM